MNTFVLIVTIVVGVADGAAGYSQEFNSFETCRVGGKTAETHIKELKDGRRGHLRWTCLKK